MTLPSVDVIIPTLNNETKLSRCLSRIVGQDYLGKMAICVVDGGSSDRTVEVARSFGAKVEIRSGAFVGGNNGARRMGERLTHGDLVWILDSDNYVVESNALTSLVYPFLESHSVALSIPQIQVAAVQPSISRWLALRESRQLARLIGRSRAREGYYENDDIDFGISNATVIRRSALEAVGGYDSDVRLLARLRARSLSAGAIVPTAHYIHDTASGGLDFRRKWVRRIRIFGKMTEQDLREFFVDYPPSDTERKRLQAGLLSEALAEPRADISEFMRTGDLTWLYGVVFPFLGASIVLAHPCAFRSLMRGYL